MRGGQTVLSLTNPCMMRRSQCRGEIRVAASVQRVEGALAESLGGLHEAFRLHRQGHNHEP